MKKPAGKGGRKHLDDDEANLWKHTAQSIEPLKRGKARVHASSGEAADLAPPRRKSQNPPETSVAQQVALKIEPRSSKDVGAQSGRVPPIAEFDRKKVRKIRSGQVEIEARIDLHGLRADEARAALRTFVHRCLGKGQRWVLVITGKGKHADRDDETPFDMSARRDRGVLKRSVPMWLEEPDLRPMIVSFTTAAIQHGGEGALYVHLRTKRP